MSPAQRVICSTWDRLRDEQANGDWHWPDKGDDDPWCGVDYATAAELKIPIERVGEALVAAGKRPPVWWVG